MNTITIELSGEDRGRLDSLTDVELERFWARSRETFSAVVGDHMRTPTV